MTHEAAKASAIIPRKGCGTCGKKRHQVKLREQARACLFFSALLAGVWMMLAPKTSLELGALENRPR